MNAQNALAVVFPPEYVHYIQSINNIRIQYDKAYPRWMPHINLIFPFVNNFDERLIVDELQNLDKSQTLIKLNEIGFFSSKGTNTYHLKSSDKTTNDNLKRIHDIAKKSCDNEAKRDFCPHMTLGQSKTSNHHKMITELNQWLDKNGPIEFCVQYITHLKRTSIGNFYEHNKYGLAKHIVLPQVLKSNLEPQLEPSNIVSQSDTYLCIDDSGSTARETMYWEAVSKLLNPSHKIIKWGTNANFITYQDAVKLAQSKAGSSGYTHPENFARMIPENSNLIIITDGCVESTSVKSCDDILQGRKFDSVIVWFCSTGGGAINMSVSAPFVRNTKMYKIYRNNVCVATGSSNHQLDLHTYYDMPTKFLNDADTIYQTIVIQNMGKTNPELRDELIALQRNLLNSLSKNCDQNDTIRQYLKENKLQDAIKEIELLIFKNDESPSESIERIIQKMISKCAIANDYSFDNLSNGRITRSQEIKSVKSDEVQEIQYNNFECPISFDDEFPILTIKKGEPVLLNVEKNDLDNYMNNPLFILNNPQLVEKIKQRIDHLFGLKTVKHLFSNNLVSPLTRSQLSSTLSFGIHESHVRATNHAMADIFFGKKLVGLSELWLTVLFNVIGEMSYIRDNLQFMEQFKEHLLHRIQNNVTNITLSGSGSLKPFMKTSIDVAMWFCVMSPWINNVDNRLRYFGDSSKYLLQILDMLHYPYHQDTFKMLKLYKVFGWMMRESKIASNWQLLIKAQYQGSIVLSCGTIILVDGPASRLTRSIGFDEKEQEQGQDPTCLPDFIQKLLDEDFTIDHLAHLASLVNPNKSTFDIVIPTDMVPKSVNSLIEENFHHTNMLKSLPNIIISPKTFRPMYIDEHSLKYWYDCANELYGQKFVSLDNYFIKYIAEKHAYPNLDEYIKYVSSKEANKESNSSNTLPIQILESVRQLFSRYEKILGKNFVDCDVKEFLRVTELSRDKKTRMKMDGTHALVSKS